MTDHESQTLLDRAESLQNAVIELDNERVIMHRAQLAFEAVPNADTREVAESALLAYQKAVESHAEADFQLTKCIWEIEAQKK